MRFLNSGARGALIVALVGAAAPALGQHYAAAGVPAVAPVGDQAPPPDLPAGQGPSGTSRSGADAARFDDVGYAQVATGGDAHAVLAWGSGLPVGGYAEVTAIDTGKTILVRTERRPAASAGVLAELSPGAAGLLGLGTGATTPVRIREMTPVAADQVALDQGRPAAPRLDAPVVLLAGLRERLTQLPRPGAATALTVTGDAPGSIAAPRLKPPSVPQAAAKAPIKTAPSKPAPKAPAAAPAPAHGGYVVRVAAFSNAANARRLARQIHGHVEAAGRFWRVELGPFGSDAAAKQARDAVAKHGYGDARVVHAD
ncbi:MAG: SPOR domain-containing protein [Sphingomonas sp.]